MEDTCTLHIAYIADFVDDFAASTVDVCVDWGEAWRVRVWRSTM